MRLGGEVRRQLRETVMTNDEQARRRNAAMRARRRAAGAKSVLVGLTGEQYDALCKAASERGVSPTEAARLAVIETVSAASASTSRRTGRRDRHA